MPKVDDLLKVAKAHLNATPFQASAREATLLLGHVLGLSEAQIYARNLDEVSEQDQQRFEELLDRRLTGEPVAHLTGEREFYGRPFQVDNRVLIPRPETEHLIEAVLDLQLPERPRILDIGTGSGSIALTLALEFPSARVFATDLSMDALQVFLANRRALGTCAPEAGQDNLSRRVHPLCSDLATAIDLRGIDLLVSNPPYVEPTAAPELSPEVVDFEPHMALFPPGSDGRAILRRLLSQCLSLRPGTPALFEIGYDQSDWLRNEIASIPELELLKFIPDLSAIERIALLHRN